jgi:hypothetical protein
VSLGIKRLLAFGDSNVIIEKVNKEGIEFQHVPRNNNIAADVLYKLGSRRALVPAGVFVQDLGKPSIKLLDLDNPEPSSNDQSSAPLRDVLMSEKRTTGGSPS